MTNKERIEDLLIEFDELDMQPMLIVPNPTDRAIRWKHELTYAIKHLEAEVAGGIFEEIKERLRRLADESKMLRDKEINLGEKTQLNGEWIGVRLALRDVAELKKKYTEEKKK